MFLHISHRPLACTRRMLIQWRWCGIRSICHKTRRLEQIAIDKFAFHFINHVLFIYDNLSISFLKNKLNKRNIFLRCWCRGTHFQWRRTMEEADVHRTHFLFLFTIWDPPSLTISIPRQVRKFIFFLVTMRPWIKISSDFMWMPCSFSKFCGLPYYLLPIF